MTGDYGSGKSSFALLLAHLMAGTRTTLPKEVGRDFAKPSSSRRFLPVLVTCSRQALSLSIVEGLLRAATHAYDKNAKSRVVADIKALLNKHDEITENEVLRAIAAVNTQITQDGKATGLFIVLDELGKFLEFAALHPERHDVFLLQRLAEAASRSNDHPLFLVCLLHQGFNAYADTLDQSAQREWEKVAGRFEEIVFNQPLEQLSELIVSALNTNTRRIHAENLAELRHAMDEAIALGWFGSSSRKTLLECATHLYPLHPTVVPVLVRAFRRFGQNERSLFSYLLSGEPFGLQAFSENAIGEVYRLHNLYDYVRSNFGHRLSTRSYRSHWNLIESVIESYATEDPLQLKILKTVGLLNLLNDSDLLPTSESLACALAPTDKAQQRQVKKALDELRRKKAIYDRGFARGLCLWPHTSVDLERAYDEARRAIQAPQKVSSYIKDVIDSRPIVARRHYIETGNLRYFSVLYCSIDQLESVAQKEQHDGNGVIVIPLCESNLEREAAVHYVIRPELASRSNWLIAVPQPLSNLATLMQEFQRWEWVATNTLELNADSYARDEVSRQKAAACLQLEKRIEDYVGLRSVQPGVHLTWFHQGKEIEIKSGRDLMTQLSRIFSETYRLAPRIHNELINRHALSSAAAAARMRLIERMFTHPAEPYLGLNPDKRPPEMSMYLSVLKNTGLHRQQVDAWSIEQPSRQADESCRILPSLSLIDDVIRKEPDSRVSVARLFDELRKPPYGVRQGLIPIFLTAYAIVHEKDVAFYKDGTFLKEVGGEAMLLLTKVPERFEIQYCKIEGVRAELFGKLLSVLGLESPRRRESELVEVVKALCVFIAQLPAYVRNTKRLPTTAVNVRDAILTAREPSKLLFTDLPIACGFEPFARDVSLTGHVHRFVDVLKSALDDLRTAFPELQERLRERLRLAFDSPGSFAEFRRTLGTRAERVVLEVTEPKLRAFCLRVMDDRLPESDWLESIGSHISLKPPNKWNDAEEELFNTELPQFTTRFNRIESIIFAKGESQSDMTGFRLAITQPNGMEHEQVVLFNAQEETIIREL